jgi:hypothetical protein
VNFFPLFWPGLRRTARANLFVWLDFGAPTLSTPGSGKRLWRPMQAIGARNCRAPFIFALMLKSETPRPRLNAAHRGST